MSIDELNDAEKAILRAPAWMCEQYISRDGKLDHECISAGEDACEILASYGLIDHSGRGANWTELGNKMLDLAPKDVG